MWVPIYSALCEVKCTQHSAWNMVDGQKVRAEWEDKWMSLPLSEPLFSALNIRKELDEMSGSQLWLHIRITWQAFIFQFYFIIIYLFILAALGLCCCAWAFSSCGEQGLLFVVVHRLLIAVASLCCRAWALGARASVVLALGLGSCGLWA